MEARCWGAEKKRFCKHCNLTGSLLRSNYNLNSRIHNSYMGTVSENKKKAQQMKKKLLAGRRWKSGHVDHPKINTPVHHSSISIFHIQIGSVTTRYWDILITPLRFLIILSTHVSLFEFFLFLLFLDNGDAGTHYQQVLLRTLTY